MDANVTIRTTSTGPFIGSLNLSQVAQKPPFLSLKRWKGFGMNNFTLRYRGRVVIKLAVRG
jgi:hypothetical protein